MLGSFSEHFFRSVSPCWPAFLDLMIFINRQPSLLLSIIYDEGDGGLFVIFESWKRLKHECSLIQYIRISK